MRLFLLIAGLFLFVHAANAELTIEITKGSLEIDILVVSVLGKFTSIP